MEILPILHTSGQKQLAFWSPKSAPCRIYGGKKGWFEEHLYAFRLKVLAIIFYSIARIIFQRLIKMSGISTYLMFSRPLETINLFCPDVYVLRMAAVHQSMKIGKGNLPRLVVARTLCTGSTTLCFKVHIFWEGNKILRNLNLTFDCMYCSQN